MNLFINALAASAGGGLTYVRNIVPVMAADPDLRLSIALPSSLRQEFREFERVSFFERDIPAGKRFWYEQSSLPALIRQAHSDVLVSAGNFALRRSPIPQILLSRNSIYSSQKFYQDLLQRHEYRVWLDTKLRGLLAKKSIDWADATVAPSEAFAEELRRWTGKSICSIHHGFDQEYFIRHSAPLPAETEERLQSGGGNSFRLLFVSHYNYYRNFETLFRAISVLRDMIRPKSLRLFLTCSLQKGANPGAYQPEHAARLIEELGIRDLVVELGSIPYHQLHHVYQSCDVYVSPAYTETFAHPLLEAMASGLPVVASDLAVHREICGSAALYFPCFLPQKLAESVMSVCADSERRESMIQEGTRRAGEFSWKKHVAQIVELAHALVSRERK
jgi:glycosyltransferase involved in cell wall biosynthesis